IEFPSRIHVERQRSVHKALDLFFIGRRQYVQLEVVDTEVVEQKCASACQWRLLSHPFCSSSRDKVASCCQYTHCPSKSRLSWQIARVFLGMVGDPCSQECSCGLKVSLYEVPQEIVDIADHTY